jgi:hypothetical protein
VKKVIILLLVVLSAAAWAEVKSHPPPVGGGTKTYLPGDLVHIVVGAPADVVEILAVAPDSQKFKLSFERRTHTWHGYWEVPYGYKKGVYNISLTALDVAGKTFTGKTKDFYIGEPALVTLVSLEAGKVSGPAVEQAIQDLAVQARISTAEAASEAKQIHEVVREVIKETRVIVQVPAKEKGPSAADLEKQKVKLLVGARANMLHREYDRARKQIEALVELEPNNEYYGRMLTRINAVIQAREEYYR